MSTLEAHGTVPWAKQKENKMKNDTGVSAASPAALYAVLELYESPYGIDHNEKILACFNNEESARTLFETNKADNVFLNDVKSECPNGWSVHALSQTEFTVGHKDEPVDQYDEFIEFKLAKITFI